MFYMENFKPTRIPLPTSIELSSKASPSIEERKELIKSFSLDRRGERSDERVESFLLHYRVSPKIMLQNTNRKYVTTANLANNGGDTSGVTGRHELDYNRRRTRAKHKSCSDHSDVCSCSVGVPESARRA